jgi:hypothetical protein
MKPKLQKHFPVRTEANPPRWYALCGYDSDNAKEFVNPQAYKPEQVAACCKKYKKLESK